MNVGKELLIYLGIIISVILIRYFVFTPVVVTGDSMNSTLYDGDLLLLKKYDHTFERGEVVVIDYKKTKLIKRVIGLPGEHLAYKDNNLYINGELIEDFIMEETEDFTLETLGYDVIPDNYYFVLGDNRDNSTDSRMIGLIDKKNIEGTVNLRIYPFNRIGIF